MTNADGTKGIDSGFQPVTAGATQIQQFTFTVNNASAPLWFFCAQQTYVISYPLLILILITIIFK